MAPETLDEYQRLYTERTEIFGNGVDTSMSVPCPFCCAPGFMKWRLLECEEVMSRGATCKECDRSIRAIFTVTSTGKQFEMVQTGGPDCTLPWLPPIRRASETT